MLINLQKTTDGYTIAVSDLIKARQNYIDKNKESIQTEIDSAKAITETSNRIISDLTKTRDNFINGGISSASDVEILNNYNQSIETEEDNLKSANDALNQSSLLMNILNTDITNTTDISDVFSTTLSNISNKTSILSSAQKRTK